MMIKSLTKSGHQSDPTAVVIRVVMVGQFDSTPSCAVQTQACIKWRAKAKIRAELEVDHRNDRRLERFNFYPYYVILMVILSLIVRLLSG